MQKTQEHPESEYLVSSEVLQLAKISRRTLERWVADGKLPSVKVGGFGSRRYKRSDIDALLRGTAAPVTPSSATPTAPVDSASPHADLAGASLREDGAAHTSTLPTATPPAQAVGVLAYSGEAPGRESEHSASRTTNERLPG